MRARSRSRRLIHYRRPGAVRKARDRMAIVFQQYNLFQNMTVLRNVMLCR